MQHDAGRIGQTVYGIIRTGANNECPSIWSDMKHQLPSKLLQVETGTRCETIFGKNEGSYVEGHYRARNETCQGTPR
jgi:hypothetical protein